MKSQKITQRSVVMLMILLFLWTMVHAEENPTLHRLLTIENVREESFANLLRVHDVNRDGIADMIMHHDTAEGFLIRLGNEDFNVFISPQNQVYLERGGQSYQPAWLQRSYAFSYDLNNDGISDFTHLVDRDFGYRTDLFSGAETVYYRLPVDEWLLESKEGIPQKYTNDHSLKFPLSTNARYDLNGDGIDDVVLVFNRCRCVGLTEGPCLTLPTTYIYFGKIDFTPFNYDARIDSTPGLLFGHTSYIGDIDGDGIDDLVLSVLDEMPNPNRDITSFRIFWGGDNFPNDWVDFTFPDGLAMHGTDPMNDSTKLIDLNNNGRADLVTTAGIISSDSNRNLSFHRPEIYDRYFGAIRWIKWNNDDYYEAVPHVPYNVFQSINIYWGDETKTYTDYTLVIDVSTNVSLFNLNYEVLPNFFNRTHGILGHFGYHHKEHKYLFHLSSTQYISDEQYIVKENDIVIPNLNISMSTYPLPFLDNLNIRIDSKEKSSIDIAVFNIRGQKIREIKSDSPQISWDGKDFSGATVSSGIYFLRATQGNNQVTTRVVKIK
ncbi:MAG: T9SS type A sorting domain-containing protein [Candidatus Cloacimonetes bacterium]|nr:T9SS type A sorting domain-containing protein [Candidatus Cloacimonadota bacterium]